MTVLMSVKIAVFGIGIIALKDANANNFIAYNAQNKTRALIPIAIWIRTASGRVFFCGVSFAD